MFFKKFLVILAVFFSGLFAAIVVHTIKRRKMADYQIPLKNNACSENKKSISVSNKNDGAAGTEKNHEDIDSCDGFNSFAGEKAGSMTIEQILEDADRIRLSNSEDFENSCFDAVNDYDSGETLLLCEVSEPVFAEIEITPEQIEETEASLNKNEADKERRDAMIDEILSSTESAVFKLSNNDKQQDKYYQRHFLELVNGCRMQNKLDKLKLSLNLCRIAKQRSLSLQNNGIEDEFVSVNEDLTGVFQKFGYECGMHCENLACGGETLFTAQQVYDYWRDDEQFNRNILNPKIKRIGLSYNNVYKNMKNYNYWVADFTD